MGRRSKYNEKIVEVICDAIATNGGDESGWVAGGISKALFYDWLNKYPDFLDLVERARSQFQKNATEYQKNLASERLKEALESGQTIKWKSRRSLRREHWQPRPDGEDRLVWYQIEDEETEHNEHRPTPQWAIERVVPKPLHTLEQLIAIAGEYGLQLVIKDEDLFNRYLAEVSSQNSQSDSGSGLTEEAASAIRGQILGMAQ